MTLQEWVKQEGGVKKCSEKWGFPMSTLSAWCRLERYPNLEHQENLIKASNHRVDLTSLRGANLDAKGKTKKAGRPRRLKGSLLVRDLDRLKVIFEEMDQPAHRCNLHGPRLVERWTTTNVTVAEVRGAISALESQGRDAANVEEIHEAIRAARKTSLQGLAS